MPSSQLCQALPDLPQLCLRQPPIRYGVVALRLDILNVIAIPGGCCLMRLP